MKFQKNTFEKLCNTLQENYNVPQNEFTYVKEYIEKNYSNDRDMLLKIKAEACDISYTEFFTTKMSIIVSLFSITGVLADLLLVGEEFYILKIGYVIMLIIITVRLFCTNQFKEVSKWAKYVIAAIEELEKEASLQQTGIECKVIMKCQKEKKNKKKKKHK